jgi:hypothetical protein
VLIYHTPHMTDFLEEHTLVTYFDTFKSYKYSFYFQKVILNRLIFMSLDHQYNSGSQSSFDEELSDNTSTEGSDMDSEFMTIENFTSDENRSNDLTSDDWEAFEAMLSFSFSGAITSNSLIMEALKQTYTKFSEYISHNQDNLDEIRLKLIISIASTAFGSNVDKINRAREERLCFEAVCLLLFSRRDYLCHDFLFNEEDFLEYYPEYAPALVGQQEYIALFKFRNLMKMAMHIIPPLHNKNHLLDLVTRLVEGKDVRHVTGTGATKATKARVGIILKEGNLVVPRRPPRLTYSSSSQKQKKPSSGRKKAKSQRGVSQPSSDVKRKRGRPRKDSVASDEPADSPINGILSRHNSNTSMTDPFNLHPATKKARLGLGLQISPSNSVDSQQPMAQTRSATEALFNYSNTVATSMDQSGYDYYTSLYDCELPMPLDLQRSQSFEFWTQTLSGGSETFKPELLRDTSFFQGFASDASASRP